MEYGKIVMHLEELLGESKRSKNKFSQRAEIQRSQVNRFCKNQITRLDTDVLARICTVFNREIGDLLEFIPPDKN